MSDRLLPRKEWAFKLEVYGASFVREAPVFNDGVLNEVWKAQTGETFLVSYVIGDHDVRLASEYVILRRIRQLLSIDPTANR